jgi:hypothetical protein
MLQHSTYSYCVLLVLYIHAYIFAPSGESLEVIQARKAQHPWGQWMAEQPEQGSGGSSQEGGTASKVGMCVCVCVRERERECVCV